MLQCFRSFVLPRLTLPVRSVIAYTTLGMSSHRYSSVREWIDNTENTGKMDLMNSTPPPDIPQPTNRRRVTRSAMDPPGPPVPPTAAAPARGQIHPAGGAGACGGGDENQEGPATPTMRNIPPQDGQDPLRVNGPGPWPYLKEYVVFLRVEGGSYIYKCELCAPKHKEISVCVGSRGNIKRHLKT